MRRIRYSVAMSLDGFIATEDGGYDWIPVDDGIDFGRFLSKIDTLLMGRRTYETTTASPEGARLLEERDVVVVSTTLVPASHPGVTVVSRDIAGEIRRLKERPGKDIWLFGGGVLFRALLEVGLVDRVEVGVIPALLGAGIPLLPGSENPAPLRLHSSETFDSGIVLLKYDVER